MARQVKPAEIHVAKAETQLEKERAAERAYYHQVRRPPGRPPTFGRRIRTAVTELAQAKVERDQAQKRQHEARDRLAKAQRLTIQLLATATFFVATVQVVARSFSSDWPVLHASTACLHGAGAVMGSGGL